jgi:hypothetical protein
MHLLGRRSCQGTALAETINMRSFRPEKSYPDNDFHFLPRIFHTQTTFRQNGGGLENDIGTLV